MEGIEDVIVTSLREGYGIAARGRVPGATGVWVGDQKIGAIGVRIAHGVRYYPPTQDQGFVVCFGA